MRLPGCDVVGLRYACPEPFDYAQDRLVEGLRTGVTRQSLGGMKRKVGEFGGFQPFSDHFRDGQ